MSMPRLEIQTKGPNLLLFFFLTLNRQGLNPSYHQVIDILVFIHKILSLDFFNFF